METPTTSDLRNNFEKSLKEVNEKINSLSAELRQAEEFRQKVLGGLETLQLLDPLSEEEILQRSQNTSTDSDGNVKV